MPKNGGNSRNQRNNPYQLEELFIKFHHTPAGIAWRWRTELLTLSGLAVLFWRLDTWTTAIWAGVILGGLAAVVAAMPHSRRFITRRFWCVLARHRLQRLCYEARLHTRSGRLPLILWTRPTKVGERTWVLCRAGHPQPPLVPARDHRRHPPRHPRRWRADRIPPGAPDRALPPAGPRPRRRAQASRLTRLGGPGLPPGPPAPTPERRHLP